MRMRDQVIGHAQKKVKAVIYSEGHVTTPILSTAFNAHAEIKYLHEPLTLTDHEGLSGKQKAELLDGVLRCGFHTLYRMGRSRWNLLQSVTTGGARKYVYENVFCYHGNQRQEQTNDCPSKLEHLQDLCSLKPHRVVKLGAVKYIKDLVPLLEEGFHVLHVVRDPRSTLATKLEEDMKSTDVNLEERTEKHLKDLRIHCNQIERDVDFITKNLLSYHENKHYQLIRYEDIEISPSDKIKELYSFLSIPLSGADMDLLDLHKLDFQKNKEETAHAWKNLTPSLVMRVQNDCERSMRLLGYMPVVNPEEGLDSVHPHGLVSFTYDMAYMS